MSWWRYLLATAALVGCTSTPTPSGLEIIFIPPNPPTSTPVDPECPDYSLSSLGNWFGNEIYYLTENGQKFYVSPNAEFIIQYVDGNTEIFRAKNTTMHVYETTNLFSDEEQNLKFELYDICSDGSPELLKIEIDIPSHNKTIAIYFQGTPFIYKAYLNNESIALDDTTENILYDYVIKAFNTLEYLFKEKGD